MAHPAGCQAVPPVQEAQLPAPRPAGACRWETGESDAWACVRPGATAADWSGRPVAGAERSAGLAPDALAQDAHPQARSINLQAALVSKAPCTPDAARSGARSFAAEVLAQPSARSARLAGSPRPAAPQARRVAVARQLVLWRCVRPAPGAALQAAGQAEPLGSRTEAQPELQEP
jgi:hypothetical protein